MKLVLKQPQDKPPFIGIQFGSDYMAGKTNSDLIGKEDYQLILEPIDRYYTNLRLVNKDLFIDRIYKQVEYNALQLQSWLQRNNKEKLFNFAHVIMDFDKHVVVKTSNNKLFIIKLNKVKMVMEE